MRTQLWLLASVGLAWITSDADAALKVMSAPNLLRVGAVENIFVECQDCPGLGPTNVQISVWNYPTKTFQLQRTMVTLNSDNQYQALGELVIPPDRFNKDPTVKQYVYLRAAFPDYILEKVVLVSFQSGYMFIQTDQPLYTPDSTVNFRVFALTPDMKPIGKDEATRDLASITVEIETPEGIVIPLGPYSLKEGMYSGRYRLGEIVSTGQWKVVARFQSNPQQTYSAEFEVKKYVLPSYEVKLISESPFFYYEAPSFTVRVKATYLFGGGVDGVAYVVFGVLGNDSRTVFPSSLQRISITGGNGEAALQKDQIPNIEELIGLSLFVTAMVYTESGSEMVEGELRNVPIVTTPYVISFDTTPKYFKPGMPFDVTVIVTNPDGSPAEGVPVVLEPGLHLSDTTQANGMVSLTVNTMPADTILTITARTNDNRLPPNRQTTKSMEARLYETKSQNYIQINVMTKSLKLGSRLKVTLQMNAQSRSFEITYLILSRGQLVHFGKQVSEGRVATALVIPVTKKMLPSFRMIAYYHATPTEVVSDSVWVDVDDSCTSTLKLEPKNPARSQESSSTFHLRVTGEPGATVGLGAVNKGLHALNNKHFLTQKKVWQTVEKADTGCTPGGGRNSMGVFFDAGLMFQTDTAVGTPYRQEHKCPPFTTTKQALTFLAHSVEENSYKVKGPITSRTKYPDSFSWVSFKIPACGGNPDCDVNTYDMDIPLIDSISSWTFTGISLSENNGICVGKPLDVLVFKTFFIDLRLPYSAVVGEQIEIRAILHNSLYDPITVEVELVENVAVCSSAWRKGRYTQQVRVGPSTTHAVPFVIIPMKEGVLNIEVKATVKDSWQGDEVRKPLQVVPNGVLTIVKKVLDLAPKGGTQEQTINSGIPKIEMVPNTPSRTKVFVTGKEPISLQRVIGASSLYRTAAQEPDYNLEVELKVPDRVAPYFYLFNRDNYYATRISKAFAVNEDVTVTARGTGEATLTMETTYYALPKETDANCKFNLSLDFSLDRVDEKDGDIYTLRVRFVFKNNEKDSSMSVLDIALPTGFILMSEDLDALSKGVSGLSSKLELNKAQSEKGSIVLYLDKVAHDRIEELALRLRRTHKVDILQPAAVSLYEYYDESTKCVKYYHPQRRDGRFLRYCRGDECSCAENKCGMQKKGHIGQRDRIDKACESTQTSRTDFVYKVILEDVAHDLSFDVYSMRIATVIKDGTLDRTASGQLRKFFSSPDCRESLNLQTKKEYLIMGAAADVIPDTSTQSFDYELSSHTWIESWPKGEQCQTEEHRPTCLGIEAFISMYEMFGCVA